MQVQFKLTIGLNEFTLVDNVDSHTEFFKKMSFYSTLPKLGPNGETDLVIQHRVAQKQYDYYSIVSKQANMEFKFGQSKDAKGTLFAKGWEPLYQGDGDESAEDGTQSAGTSVGLGGLGATSAPAAAQPAATKAATPGLGTANLGAGLGTPKQTPAPAPTPAATTAAPTPAANPAVQKNAANILSKFGI